MKISFRFLLSVFCLALAARHAKAGMHTWTGASTNGLWTTSGNWQSSSAPVLNESPLHLVFPSSATRKIITNDFDFPSFPRRFYRFVVAD